VSMPVRPLVCLSVLKTRVVSNIGKSIAIAIAILGRRSVAILIAIFFSDQYCNTTAKLFTILHYALFPNKF